MFQGVSHAPISTKGTPSLLNFGGSLANAHAVRHTMTEVSMISYVQAGLDFKGQPRHSILNRCVARFVSDNRVSC